MDDIARLQKELKKYEDNIRQKYKIKSHNVKVLTMGWTCPQCGVNYSPNVVRCPCTEKKNQEPPKDKSILDGMPVTNKEFNLKVEHKTI